MIRNFRTYEIAVEFYQRTATLKLPRHLKDQLSRASSSIVLNIAESSGRSSKKEQRRFFEIAFGSLRESQAILALSCSTNSQAQNCADILAAHLYKLIQHLTATS